MAHGTFTNESRLVNALPHFFSLIFCYFQAKLDDARRPYIFQTLLLSNLSLNTDPFTLTIIIDISRYLIYMLVRTLVIK